MSAEKPNGENGKSGYFNNKRFVQGEDGAKSKKRKKSSDGFAGAVPGSQPTCQGTAEGAKKLDGK